jgi:hypothetical protein
MATACRPYKLMPVLLESQCSLSWLLRLVEFCVPSHPLRLAAVSRQGAAAATGSSTAHSPCAQHGFQHDGTKNW